MSHEPDPHPHTAPEPSSPAHAAEKKLVSRWSGWLLALMLAWLGIAYLVAPAIWKVDSRRHRNWDNNPRITHTKDGHPGDPLNVALIGSEEQLRAAMTAAGWHEAARLGIRSDLKIAEDTVLSRPDVDAPVSNLYLFDRPEDYAFEFPVGDNPRQRHHVRFWKAPPDEQQPGAPPGWLGSATYDERVGLSHTTGQITHHISGDIDKERDFMMNSLVSKGLVTGVETDPDFHQEHSGKNGGGDEWHTDGALEIGTLTVTP